MGGKFTFERRLTPKTDTSENLILVSKKHGSNKKPISTSNKKTRTPNINHHENTNAIKNSKRNTQRLKTESNAHTQGENAGSSRTQNIEKESTLPVKVRFYFQ